MKKHLHTRGDDNDALKHFQSSEETPPRKWRRLLPLRPSWPTDRNTSTHMETTGDAKRKQTFDWKHLHTRGDDAWPLTETPSNLETPPPTWRQLQISGFILLRVGNTSTLVGMTFLLTLFGTIGLKHIHSCEDDVTHAATQLIKQETHPLLWRRITVTSNRLEPERNTSTTVEKKDITSKLHQHPKKHLHTRGDD